jgi:hypothetical protein
MLRGAVIQVIQINAKPYACQKETYDFSNYAQDIFLGFTSAFRKLLLELGCVNVNSSVQQDGPISHGVCKEVIF